MFGNTDKPVENIANDTFGISRYIMFWTNCIKR